MEFMKALFGRVRKADKDAADAIRDVVAEGAFAIEDAEKEIVLYRGKIAEIVAANKSTVRRLEEAKNKVTTMLNAAKVAANQNKDDDAKKLLEQKNLAQNEVTTLQGEVAKNEAVITQMKTQIDKAQSKISAAKSNQTRLAARHASAKIRQDLAQATTNFGGGNSALASLEKLTEAVDKEESKAEALEEMASASTAGEDLAAKYANPPSNLDDELAMLKAGK
jgi:phage shock protein A